MYNTDNEIKIKEYINNYISELQRHFDISDNKMRIILRKIYKDSGKISKIHDFVKKYLSMVKSFYMKIKRTK